MVARQLRRQTTRGRSRLGDDLSQAPPDTPNKIIATKKLLGILNAPLLDQNTISQRVIPVADIEPDF